MGRGGSGCLQQEPRWDVARNDVSISRPHALEIVRTELPFGREPLCELLRFRRGGRGLERACALGARLRQVAGLRQPIMPRAISLSTVDAAAAGVGPCEA